MFCCKEIRHSRFLTSTSCEEIAFKKFFPEYFLNAIVGRIHGFCGEKIELKNAVISAANQRIDWW